MVHDVNNLIGALDLRVQLMTRDPVCAESQKDNLRAMQQIICEAGMLLDRLHSLAQESDAPPAGVDLRQAIVESVSLASSGLRLRARQSGISLKLEHDVGPLPTVVGTPDDVRLRLLGVLMGAGDAMRRGGVIHLGATSGARAVVVRVARGSRGRGQTLGEVRFPRERNATPGTGALRARKEEA